MRHLVITALSLALLADGRGAAAQTIDGQLVARDGGHAFVYTVTNSSSKDPKWAVVEINHADGSRQCEWLKKLDAKQSYRFECPIEVAGDRVPSRVRLYKDAKLEHRETFEDPVVNVSAGVLAAAVKAAAAPATATTVPDGTLEAAELPVPTTFKPTWYRRIERGFAMRAYEHSGDLTVEADALVFVDGKKTVRIPYARILSIRWEPMANDIANHWTAVRFTNDEGQPDGVAFRDGGMLGRSQGTGMIYVSLRRAARK